MVDSVALVVTILTSFFVALFVHSSVPFDLLPSLSKVQELSRVWPRTSEETNENKTQFDRCIDDAGDIVRVSARSGGAGRQSRAQLAHDDRRRHRQTRNAATFVRFVDIRRMCFVIRSHT